MHFTAAIRGLAAVVVGTGVFGVCTLGTQGCSGGGGGGGGGAPPATPTVSAPAQGAFVGQVVDQNNAPVANAEVSVDGISTTTDSSGRFALNSTPVVTAPATVGGRATPGASANVRVGVAGQGVQSVELPITFNDGEVPLVQILRPSVVAGLDVTKPHEGCDYVIPANCPNPFIPVEGYASLSVRESLAFDVCLLIDRSGSTAQAVGFEVNNAPNTVLGAEIEAARCFVDALGVRSKLRLAVVAFADGGGTQVVQGFTTDRAAVHTALTGILNGSSAGGTDFAEGIDTARALYATLDAGDAADLSQDSGGEVRVLPNRMLVMLSDGIPTAPFGSNLTQEREDRVAALDAARRAVADRIEVHGFALIRGNDSQGPLSTLPQIAAITGGSYHRIASANQLATLLCQTPLTQVTEVRVRNRQVGNSEVVAMVGPDGFFAVEMPVRLNNTNNSNTNTIEITVETGSPSQRLVRTVDVELHPEAIVGTQNFDMISLQPVSSAGIVTPDGSSPGNQGLQTFLSNQFPDALQVRGVEAFSVAGPAGNTVAVQVDLVFEDAGFSSDFGYFSYDPMNPPTTAQQALQNAVVIFNTGGIGGGSQTSGAHRFSTNFTAGQTVGFFVVPNDTLARAQAGNANNDPLFTLSALNPGGIPQVLNFQSANGRTTAAPANPNVLVFAFEDLAIAARRKSDRDFNDVVFTVSSQVRPKPTAIICR